MGWLSLSLRAQGIRQAQSGVAKDLGWKIEYARRLRPRMARVINGALSVSEKVTTDPFLWEK